MAKESFNYIEFSDESLFTKTNDGKIALKEYTDDLVFYSSFDSTFDAIFSLGDATATVNGSATNEINAVFGQSVLLDDATIRYDKNNFDTLTTEGNIDFRVKANFLTGKGFQSFVRTTKPIITSVPTITTEEYNLGGGSLYLLGDEQKNISYDINNISSMIQEGTIEFGIKFVEQPTVDYMFFMIGNESDNKNLIRATYKTDGKIYFEIYDQTGTLLVGISFDWNVDTNWHTFSFNFDLNNGSSKVFVDGIQYGIEATITGTRDNNFTYFYVGSGDSSYITNFYLDSFNVFSIVQRTSNYTVSNTELTGIEDNLLVNAKYDINIDLDFGTNKTHISTLPASNEYNFKLYVDGVLQTITVTLESDDSLVNISDKIANVITNSHSTINDAGEIEITATSSGARISIESPDAGRDLLTILDGVNDAIMPNASFSDIILVEFSNLVDDKNKIQIIHTTKSEILLKMYDSDGNEIINNVMFIWNNDDSTWYNFNFSWNKTIGQFFLDGTLQNVFVTNFERGSNCYLTLSTLTSGYYFDEFIIKNKYGYTNNYTVTTYALTPYATNDPYIDIHFGTGFKEDEVKDLNLIASENTGYVVKLGNIWYYYFSGSWRESNGTYAQSVSPSYLETKFSELYFDENLELIIRVYFHSDGLDPSWIDDINIITVIGDETSAIIVGTVSINSPVDMTSNSHVLISTDQGSLEVDLSSSATDVSAVTTDEILTAINNAGVPGLAPATIDDKNHLVLSSIDTGTSSYISISNGITSDILPMVWGYETTDSGEEATGTYFDYTEIINWVRIRLGGGVVPVELTDEQIESCVSEAVYWYNYYRNAKEKEITVMLVGNDKDGYTIPPEVGGEENIIEIIMKPRFPLAYYGGGTDNMMSNLYMQWFFGSHVGSGYQNIVGDYYITLSTEKDMENILGTQVKWEFFNGKIFLSPIPTSSLLVGIKFKSAISIEEINTNQLIRAYTLAKAKQILGTIRSTFGGTIPGGGETITLRGESLIQEGKEEEKETLEKMYKLSEPIFLQWF